MLFGYLSDFFSLFYPELCQACGNALYKGEEVICLFCRHHLPYTNYHLEADNKVAKAFWGRVQIEAAASCLYFKKGTRVQHLLHQLKYKGKKEVGITLGVMYGRQLKKADVFSNIDMIVPVPLHNKKEAKRGYNQSAVFAEGLASSMGVKHAPLLLERISETETQTKKSRYNRFENMNNVFRLKDPEAVCGKHVLFVDDVITTGATLEACAQELLLVKNVRVSIATIAFAV